MCFTPTDHVFRRKVHEETGKKFVGPHILLQYRKLFLILPRENAKKLQLSHINMIIVQVKEGEQIERALKKFKRKFEKTGIVKELRSRQAFQKPSVTNRKKMMKAVYVQKLRSVED